MNYAMPDGVDVRNGSNTRAFCRCAVVASNCLQRCATRGRSGQFNVAFPQTGRRIIWKAFPNFVKASLLAAGSGIEYKNFHDVGPASTSAANGIGKCNPRSKCLATLRLNLNVKGMRTTFGRLAFAPASDEKFRQRQNLMVHSQTAMPAQATSRGLSMVN
jgi:hypothetical protein